MLESDAPIIQICTQIKPYITVKKSEIALHVRNKTQFNCHVLNILGSYPCYDEAQCSKSYQLMETMKLIYN